MYSDTQLWLCMAGAFLIGYGIAELRINIKKH